MNFNDRVYQVVLQIPPGKVATYGQIAMLLGSPRASRAVGSALLNSPLPGVLPCHRVVNRNGALAPSRVFGKGVQQALLEQEGVEVLAEGLVSLRRYQWDGGVGVQNP